MYVYICVYICVCVCINNILITNVGPMKQQYWPKVSFQCRPDESKQYWPKMNFQCRPDESKQILAQSKCTM